MWSHEGSQANKPVYTRMGRNNKWDIYSQRLQFWNNQTHRIETSDTIVMRKWIVMWKT